MADGNIHQVENHKTIIQEERMKLLIIDQGVDTKKLAEMGGCCLNKPSNPK